MIKKIIIGIIAFLVIGAVVVFQNNINKPSFKATVLENMGTSLLVEPLQGEDELKSSDKITVRVYEKNNKLMDVSEFIKGSRVIITYDGVILESYPAQINARKIKSAK